MIAILDYGVGNLNSVATALRRSGAQPQIVRRSEDVLRAEKIIFPGVGSLGQAMQTLLASGLLPAIERKVFDEKTPVLGICLGMQMLSRYSEEGDAKGLGWIAADTRLFRHENGANVRVPHLGWNEVRVRRSHPLLEGISHPPAFYFAHSYHLVCDRQEDVLATTTHGYEFTCAVQVGNIHGVQFHPEKSHAIGKRVIDNFLSL